MIKAVLVDVDDTLLDFDESAKMSMKMAAEEQGIRLPDNIWEIFVQINEVLWRDLEKGLLTSEELFHVRWTRIFEAADVVADGPTFEAAFLRGLSVCTPLIDGAVEIMEYLHGKYLVGIASNGPYEQQVDRLTKVGIMPYVDHLFVSGKIGHAKPSKDFFDACMAELSAHAAQSSTFVPEPPNHNAEPSDCAADLARTLHPEEVMMIGDSISADISGAKAYGMQTCWYNHKAAPADHGKMADYQVSSLRQIKEIL